MFEDDEEQSPAERRAENLAPKTRDLAAEITPSGANEDDDLEAGMLEQRDRVANISVDGETATAFWSAVVYVNVGLLLFFVGPMLIVFRGRTQIGPLVMIVGTFALYRAYSVYRGYKNSPAKADERAEGAGEEGVSDEADSDEAQSDGDDGGDGDDGDDGDEGDEPAVGAPRNKDHDAVSEEPVSGDEPPESD